MAEQEYAFDSGVIIRLAADGRSVTFADMGGDPAKSVTVSLTPPAEHTLTQAEVLALIRTFARANFDWDNLRAFGSSDLGADTHFPLQVDGEDGRISLGALFAADPDTGGRATDRALIQTAIAYSSFAYTAATSMLRVTSIGGQAKDIDLGIQDFAKDGDTTLVDWQASIQATVDILAREIKRATYINSTRVTVAFGGAQYQVPGSTSPTVAYSHGVLSLQVDNTVYPFSLQSLLDKAPVAPAATLSAGNSVALQISADNSNEFYFLARRTDGTLAFSSTETGSHTLHLTLTYLEVVPDTASEGDTIVRRSGVWKAEQPQTSTGGLTESQVLDLIRKNRIPVDASLDGNVTGVLGMDGDVNANDINQNFTDANGTERVLSRLFQDGQTHDLEVYVAGNIPQEALMGIIFDLNGTRFHLTDAIYDGYNGTVTEWSFIGVTAGTFKAGANTLVIYEPTDRFNFVPNSPGTGQPFLGNTPPAFGDLDARHIIDGTITADKMVGGQRIPPYTKPRDILGANDTNDGLTFYEFVQLTLAQIVVGINGLTGTNRVSYGALKDVPATITGLQHTPRRVAPLPTSVEENETVYLTRAEVAAYAHIVPHSFERGPLAGEGFGTRGWYEDRAINYGEGTLYGPLPGMLLVSDTKVAIAVTADPSTGLTKLYLGSTEYALTRDTGLQNVPLGNVDGATRVNVYTIASALPAGNWEQIKVEGPTGTFIPPLAGQVRPVGLYIGKDNFWHGWLFNAPAGNLAFSFSVPVEQSLPATPVNKTLTFTAPVDADHPYSVQNPFDDVDRIEMYVGLGQPELNRYRVRMSGPVTGNDVPTRLKVGTALYALTPIPDSTDHSFQTPVIPPANRPSATQLVIGMDLQFAGGHWAEGGAGITLPYTLALHQLQRSLATPHSGSEFPLQPYDGEIFTTTHTQTIDGVEYPPNTYIHIAGSWGVPNVRTEAAAEALIRRVVADWAEANNTDELPIAKVPFDDIQDRILQATDERYYRSQDLPYPATSQLAPEDRARAILQAQQHEGGLPIRAPVDFPPYTNPAWQPPPGQSNHGYTTGSSNIKAINLPSPFEQRMIMWPATHYQAALRDRLQFYLSDDFEADRLPTHIGIADGETGAVTRLLIARDSRRGEWTSAPLGVAALRVPVAGARRYLTLYNAAGTELILNKDLFGQAGVVVTDLRYKLWSFDQGNNKAQIASLGNGQFATPSTWDTPLALSKIPDKCRLQLRLKLDGKTDWIESAPFSVAAFKGLPAITSISEDRNVLQEIMLGAETVTYHATPNCIQANIRAWDRLFLAHRSGELTFASQNIAYWRDTNSDFEIWVLTP